MPLEADTQTHAYWLCWQKNNNTIIWSLPNYYNYTGILGYSPVTLGKWNTDTNSL